MKINNIFFCGMLASAALVFGQAVPANKGSQVGVKRPLDVRVEHFDVTDAILRDGTSELSLKDIDGLHLGFEEIIRNKIQDDPGEQSPRFSLHLAGKTVRELLDELCKSDARYAWSEDEATINVYPRVVVGEPSYLLDLWIEKLMVNRFPDPDQALVPLSRRFPEQQVGYAGPGLGDNTYAEPWTATFDHLTVRQFVNRIAEHMGPRTSWVWQGGKDERMFTFLKGGFRTTRAATTTIQ